MRAGQLAHDGSCDEKFLVELGEKCEQKNRTGSYRVLLNVLLFDALNCVVYLTACSLWSHARLLLLSVDAVMRVISSMIVDCLPEHSSSPSTSQRAALVKLN